MLRTPRAVVVLPLLFFVSGATALAGQVVLNRLLGYVFGASHLATATVLAAYMGGLALGALWMSRFAPRLRRPIVSYAVLELGVAAFFALLPAVYPLFQAAGVGLGRALGMERMAFTLVRFALSFGFVLVPTVLMGATLPALISAFGGRDGLRRHLPRLYALNTLGGAAGAFLAGYALVYAVGIDGTAYLCAIANTFVGAVALAVAASTRPDESGCAGKPAAAVEGEDRSWALSPALVCALAFAQGALSFSLEVVWSHLIRTVIGVTTYSFTVMLTTILLGIGLGSWALIAFDRGRESPLQLFVFAQLLLAGALATSLFVWDRFPDLITFALRRRYEWSFAAREGLRFLFAVPLLLPAGFALGLSLPALTTAVRGGGGERGEGGGWVGRVFGFNTLGAIAGALFTGFVLLGRVPSEWLMRGAVLAALGLAVAPYVATRPRRRPRGAVLAIAAGTLAAVAVFPGWDLRRLTSGKHMTWDFYDEGSSADIVFVREDAQSGFVTVEKNRDGVRVMKTNGKYEGTDALGEFQDNLALIGALYLRHFDRAALIGLGPGRALALLHEMPFRQIEAVEFSPAIAAAARSEFPDVSGAALADQARVNVILDDGRNRLQLSPFEYDYVVVAITGAAFAGSGGIYNRDFFEVVRSRLAPEGVFLMWIQTHHIFPEDVRSVAFSMRSVFPHVHFYAVPEGQGYLVSSLSALRINPKVAERLGRTPRAAQALSARGHASAVELVAWSMMSRDQDLSQYLASPLIRAPAILYTDLRPRFEFTAPMGLATRILRQDFSPFASPGLPAFAPPLDPEENARLSRLRDLALGRWPLQEPGAGDPHSAASSASN